MIGDFQVLAQLGQGGMGTVYRARQVALDRVVALKILPAQFQDDPAYVSRFQREATGAASLRHPNLVRVFAAGCADGCHYIAMELVEGENLRRRMQRGSLAPADAVRICLDVARGLQCGWQAAQLIHRDVKPSNIYLSAQTGRAKLGDLGLAKSVLSETAALTHSGATIGTPHYLSPEQARGEKAIDLRADIYSLGCTLYELLTGATPFRGGDPLTIISMHLHAPAPAILKVLPDCPLPLARLVSRMLRKARRERPQTYEELIVSMEQVLAHLETGAPVESVAPAGGSPPA
jgi:serine/threonine-protein kinase